MKIEDIYKVRVDWMEGFINEPRLQFILKRDRKLIPWSEFRFRQYDELYFALKENEVRFVKHNKNDHEGFGGAKYVLHMDDLYRSPAQELVGRLTNMTNSWTSVNCHRRHGQMENGRYVTVMEQGCNYDPTTNIVTLYGPWSSNTVYALQQTGVDCVQVSVLEGPSREAVAHPRWYQKRRRQGVRYEGTPFATEVTLEFAKEAVDRLAPHVEMWKGDYGWTVKLRGMEPKNPPRHPQYAVRSFPNMGSEQIGAILAYGVRSPCERRIH